jgi:uncharacterized membrane protein
MQNRYSWGFYNDPNDRRFVVPKMNPALGWTVNVAHPSARLALVLMALVLVAGMAGSIFLG